MTNESTTDKNHSNTDHTSKITYKRTWYNRLILDGFFGWENFKWFIREMSKTFSGEPSFFTSKRVERFAFVTSGLIFYYVYMYYHIATMTATDFLIVSGPLFVYAGYNLKQIQKEKSDNNNSITS